MALELGASDFLLQPIDPREFTRRIGNVLALEAERREMAPFNESRRKHGSMLAVST